MGRAELKVWWAKSKILRSREINFKNL